MIRVGVHSYVCTCIYVCIYVTVLAKRDQLCKNNCTVEAVFGQNTKTFHATFFLFFLVSSIFYPLPTLMLSFERVEVLLKGQARCLKTAT